MMNYNQSQVTINAEENVVTVIRYMWFDKDPEILLICRKNTFVYDFPQDGVYEIYQMEVNTEFSNYLLENGKLFFKSDDGLLTLIATFNESGDLISSVNQEDIDAFIKEDEPTNAVCYTDLEKCLADFVIQILNLKVKNECDPKTNTVIHTKRDLIWMALIAIKYFSELGLLTEVQRIIESFDCDYCLDSRLNNSNCGCHA